MLAIHMVLSAPAVALAAASLTLVLHFAWEMLQASAFVPFAESAWAGATRCAQAAPKPANVTCHLLRHGLIVRNQRLAAAYAAMPDTRNRPLRNARTFMM